MNPPTAEQIQILRRHLLDKGAEINAKLTELLAGKRVDVDTLLGASKPGESREERLRRFLALVDGRIQAIRAGTYGRCASCEDGLPFADLEQIPWIDTCRACSAKA